MFTFTLQCNGKRVPGALCSWIKWQERKNAKAPTFSELHELYTMLIIHSVSCKPHNC
jgi:hypothetical protein